MINSHTPDRRLRSRCALMLILGVSSAYTVACRDFVLPTDELSGAGERRVQIGIGHVPRLWTLDDEFARIASEEIPGFGGFFVDQSGTLNISLTDTDGSDEAGRVLARVWDARGLGKGMRVDPGRVRVRPARFNFVELKGWRETARALIGVGGVVSLDADEVRNRVVVGITRATARGDVTRGLSWLGVPIEAVIIEEVPPFVPFQLEVTEPPDYNLGGGGSGSATKTLKSYFRPLIGGFEITFDKNPDDGLVDPCTLGVNAVDNSGNYGFLTNSHCTRVRGGPEFTYFDQGGQYIGVEAADPFYRTTSSWSGAQCPANYTCRYSDAAFATHATSAWSYGYIAKTESDAGGKVYKGVFKITYEDRIPAAPPSVGWRMEKVGAETGWTYGTMAETCRDAEGGDNKWYFCQDIVATALEPGAAPGDSGAPVFTRVSGTDEVYFYGSSSI